jgi:DNA-binding transcriptional LysR family regulator
MEIFELRYFLEAARTENIHRASEKLNISPGSISKAVTRLEEELSIKLFHRVGRNIELTDQGRLLQRRASTIVQLEEAAKLEVAGHPGSIQIIIAGPEILLSQMGVSLSHTIQKKFPLSKFEFRATNDEEATAQVFKGEAHLAIVTTDAPSNSNLSSKILGEAEFQTYVGENHPLYGKAKAKKTVPIEEVLAHPFASPNNPLLGKVGAKQSLDGWRDDQFPRKVEYLTSSLKILEELAVSGKAIAYLPGYFCETLPLESLKISGCPYKCVQKIWLVARNPKEISWLNQIF